jgi:hypothetical protein
VTGNIISSIKTFSFCWSRFYTLAMPVYLFIYYDSINARESGLGSIKIIVGSESTTQLIRTPLSSVPYKVDVIVSKQRNCKSESCVVITPILKNSEIEDQIDLYSYNLPLPQSFSTGVLLNSKTNVVSRFVYGIDTVDDPWENYIRLEKISRQKPWQDIRKFALPGYRLVSSFPVAKDRRLLLYDIVDGAYVTSISNNSGKVIHCFPDLTRSQERFSLYVNQCIAYYLGVDPFLLKPKKIKSCKAKSNSCVAVTWPKVSTNREKE